MKIIIFYDENSDIMEYAAISETMDKAILNTKTQKEKSMHLYYNWMAFI